MINMENAFEAVLRAVLNEDRFIDVKQVRENMNLAIGTLYTDELTSVKHTKNLHTREWDIIIFLDDSTDTLVATEAELPFPCDIDDVRGEL
jgi:hypothetical protein